MASKKLTSFWRAVTEISFIIFLFYSNLLMGEFNHSGVGQKNGLLWAINDIFTIPNFTIALSMALICHLVFEFLRKKALNQWLNASAPLTIPQQGGMFE